MTEKPDLDHLRQWIGRGTVAADVVTAQLVRGLRATLFLEIGEPKPGDAAPFTAHWCLAQPVFPASELGPDGHPARGGFLPPVPLPRRMWAGGELEFVDGLRVGDEVTRTSTIADVTLKAGSSGTLCFVSVNHEVTTPRGVAIRERQDIVYRDVSTTSAAPTKPTGPAPIKAICAERSAMVESVAKANSYHTSQSAARSFHLRVAAENYSPAFSDVTIFTWFPPARLAQ